MEISKRYIVGDKLGKGGMGTVYRAVDRLTGNIIAIKHVNTSVSDVDIQGSATPEVGTPEMGLALAVEFRTLSGLRHPNIVSVLDYGFDFHRQPFFTMQLIEGAQILTEFGEDRSQEEQIRLLIETLQALSYLHNRGIIHRDVKPANVLVSHDGVAKVMDFGLALHQLQSITNVYENAVGTFAYMAPELFEDKTADVKTDLFAFGVMAYELFAGEHPFLADNVMYIVMKIMESERDLSLIDDRFAHIVGKLIARNAEDRYNSADEVIDALSAAIGKPPPAEDILLRESYLQSARFVGRDTELDQLKQALELAFEGKGSAWLIGGESGVGKSRLLEEIRSRAMVKGALVLQAQAVAEGGLYFQSWRETLRELALVAELTDTEAGNIKGVVPDLDRILGRPIPNLLDVDVGDIEERLSDTIVGVLRRLAQREDPKQPVVLIMEDLQWANRSLPPLQRLSEIVDDLNMLIIGSYRDDERPDMPELLPNMTLMPLKRLTDDAMVDLSVSIMGEAGRQPEVLAFLKRETEGNAFFVVEVLRALAEEAGRLRDIGTMKLPTRVFAEGIKDVVERRLNRITGDYREILNTAALIGRALDTDVLRLIYPAQDMETWLTACVSASVIDAQEADLRFAHEKLREGALNALDDADRKHHHLKIADALVSQYGDKEYAYDRIIAEHYERGGDALTAAEWYSHAGNKDRHVGESRERRAELLRKALEIRESQLDIASLPTEKQIEIARVRAWMLRDSEDYDEAIKNFEHIYELAQSLHDVQEEVRALYSIGKLQNIQSRFKESAMTAIKVDALANKAGMRLEFAKALILRGWSAFASQHYDTAIELGERALAPIQEIGNQSATIDCLNLLGGANYFLGELEKSTGYMHTALEITNTLGDRSSASSLTNNLGILALARGDFAAAHDYYQDALNNAIEHGDTESQINLYKSNLGDIHVLMGEFDYAVDMLREVVESDHAHESPQITNTYRALAQAYLGINQTEQALEACRKALQLVEATGITDYAADIWRILGNIIAESKQDTLQINDGGKSYTARDSFKEARRIIEETRNETDHAELLVDWARYEQKHGDKEQAKKLWQQAHEIYKQIGADKILEQMGNLPPED